MLYRIRPATPEDHDFIYGLKAESVRPYVEKIWGWDETYQRADFDADFSAIEQFHVVETDGGRAGFVQYNRHHSCLEIVEIHLLPAYRGHGIGSDLIRHLRKECAASGTKIRIGCFKENLGAKRLYRKLGFVPAEETDTHYILEYRGEGSGHDDESAPES